MDHINAIDNRTSAQTVEQCPSSVGVGHPKVPPYRKILHIFKVFPPDVYGGIPYVIAYCMAVGKRLFRQDLIITSTNPSVQAGSEPSIERVRSFGNLFSLPLAPWYPLRLWQKAKNYDLLVLHAPFPLADLVFGLGFRPSIPLAVYWHADVVTHHRLGRVIWPLMAKTLERALIIAVSNRRAVHREEILERFGHKIVEIPFPVDVQKFTPNAAERADIQRLQVEYPHLVIAVGRLVGYKGFDILIKAIKPIENAQLLIVGEGKERARLQSLISTSGLEHRVKLLGSVDERSLVSYLNAARVFVLPSVSEAETFGIVQIEAMAAGLPIVNTSLSTAVPLVARHGHEAITVKPNDETALTHAIKAILTDEVLRKSLIANARERLQDFSGDVFEERIIQFYLAAMQRTSCECPAQ